MKSLFVNGLCAAALAAGAAACNPSADSVQQAQNANEIKIDNAPGTTAKADSVKDAQKNDSEFLTKAASGSMLEVEMGRAVAKRATLPSVRQAAEQMVKDHTKSTAAIKALAAKRNLTLPSALGDEQRKAYDDVLAKKGADLDREYVKEMVKDHQDDIKEFSEAADSGADAEVKAFAKQTVPTLQMHLAMFQKLQNTLK